VLPYYSCIEEYKKELILNNALFEDPILKNKRLSVLVVIIYTKDFLSLNSIILSYSIFEQIYDSF